MLWNVLFSLNLLSAQFVGLLFGKAANWKALPMFCNSVLCICIRWWSIFIYLLFILWFLGKLVLKIPWKNLYSEAVIANIEGLYLLVRPNTGLFINVESNWNAQVPTSQNYFYSASNNWNMGFWNSNVPILTSLFSTGSCGSESLLKRIISMGLYSTAWNHCNIRHGIPAVVGCGFTADWMRHDLKGHAA